MVSHDILLFLLFLKKAKVLQTPARQAFLQFGMPTAIRLFKRLLHGLGLWVLCILTMQPALAQDHITHRAWLEDPTGLLTWPQVATRPAQTFEGVLSRGFGEAVVWVQLRIDPGARPLPKREADQLILRIRPVYLDDIQVFDPLAPDGRAGVTGDLHHPRAQPMEGPDFLLPIARGEVPRDIWLRLSSTSTRQITVQALNTDDLQRQTQIQDLVFALYIGVILVFIVWGAIYWLFSGELVIGAFGLKQTAALVFALSSLGYSRVFWPEGWSAHWLDETTTLSGIVAVSSAVYFHVVLLREFNPPRWIVHVHRMMLGLLPVKLLLVAAQQSMLALQINMAEVLLAPFIFLLSVLVARVWSQQQSPQRPVLTRWVVLSFYTSMLLILLVAGLTGLGWAKGGEIPLYVVQAHGLVTAFLVLLMLQYRAHIQQKHQRDTAIALEQSQLQARQERSIREEQEKLLTMLAHELRTPLAIMSMRLDATAAGSNEIRHAIRDMNAVIERCQQTAQFGDRQLQAQLSSVDLAGMVKEAVSACAQPERMRLQLAPQLQAQTDQQLLFIVLSNLLENSCKYAAAETPIDVRLSASAWQARIEVCNLPGTAGWPEASKVFDKYYRSPHAKRQAGTGLGLYLVSKLMLVLGGGIEYQPDERNVRFVIWLPLAETAP